MRAMLPKFPFHCVVINFATECTKWDAHGYFKCSSNVEQDNESKFHFTKLENDDILSRLRRQLSVHANTANVVSLGSRLTIDSGQ